MAQLPIRKLTLYKQGIGYFERGGETDERTISLVIPREATNDVLKSLNVIVRRGSPVLSVDYETPEDKTKILSEIPVKMADRSSMVDLLASLRGSRARLNTGGVEAISGRIVGVEASLDSDTHPATVVIQSDVNLIRVVSISDLESIELLDERAATDVDYFLDVSRTEQTRTTLTMRLAEGQHDLEIGYLAPSPVWRVSYRIVGGERNTAHLLGWGLFDNSLDEDLENVSLTLMSGRPISFEYGLYESRVPSRPQVSDDPIPLESVSTDPRMVEAISSISHDLRSPLASVSSSIYLIEKVGTLNPKQSEIVKMISQQVNRMMTLMNELLDMMRLREKQDNSSALSSGVSYQSGPLGDLKVSSSYFMPMLMGNAEPEYMIYEVKTPVSVRRGQSAMVPLIDATVEYEQLCVYNGDKMPNHPLLVWRFQNTTNMALEQGSVTLIRDGQYLGEGLLRFSGADDDIQIPYALEFGILVTETNDWSEKQLFELDFDADKRQAVVRRSQISEYTYTLLSRSSSDKTVYIERRDPKQGQYHEMPPPVLEMAGHTRWQVSIPAGGETTFTIRVRDVYENAEDAASWSEDFVGELREARILVDNKYRILESLAQARRNAKEANDEIKSLQAESTQVANMQEQLRKNLEVLGDSEREMGIRNHLLDDLENSENRRRDIASNIVRLNAQLKQNQQNEQSLIDQLYSA